MVLLYQQNGTEWHLKFKGWNEMTIKTELIKKYLSDYILNCISDFEIDENKIVSIKAVDLLNEIQTIIQNDKFSDFDKVEKIVCLFDENHINAGCCHDF